MIEDHKKSKSDLIEEINRLKKQLNTSLDNNLLFNQNEFNYKYIFEHTKDAISIAKDSKHVKVNRAFLELFGFSSYSEVIGENVIHQIAESERNTIIKRQNAQLKGQFEPLDYITIGKRSNGS